MGSKRDLGKNSVIKIDSDGLGGKTSNPKNDVAETIKKPKEATKIPPEYEKMWKSPREK